MLIAICVGLSLSCIVLSGVALTMACVSWARVEGMEKSTHQIQYVPLENEKGEVLEGEKLEENIMKAMGQEYQIERDYL